MTEDVSPEVISETQRILGKHIKKPQLTDRYLKKPPFRFIHDVIVAVVKDTGFLKGLFGAKELVSDNVKEKDAKIAFLTKLIDAVKSITKIDLQVRPAKITSGLEVKQTNLLLQAIGKALDKKLDSTDYVKAFKDDVAKKLKAKESNDKVKPKKTNSKDETPKSTNRSIDKIKKEAEIKTSKSKKSKDETARETDRNKEKKKKERTKVDEHNNKNKEITKEITAPSPEEKPKKIKKETHRIPDETHDAITEAPKLQPNKENIEITTPKETLKIETHNESLDDHNNLPVSDQAQSVTHLIRPKSARPKSGDFTKPPKEEENVKKPEEPPKEVPKTRPKSSLRPPSVRPSSARPGAPRLRPETALPPEELVTLGKINVIVENFDKNNDQDDNDTVIIHQTSEIVAVSNLSMPIPENNQGHLVEQILEQFSDNEIPKTVEPDFTVNDIKTVSGEEISKLRAAIQNSTRSSNLLGKLFNYLHEDVEAMYSELQQWTSTQQQLFKEIEKQKQISNDMSKPLFATLDNLNREIEKQEQEIASIRSVILRNEARIEALTMK